VHWQGDARKLRTKDKQIVSPSFEVFPGHAFKIMLKPKEMGDKKGQANFQRARGCGRVELKCIQSLHAPPTLRFYISIGRTESERRGPSSP
jgi:hypothetical protein